MEKQNIKFLIFSLVFLICNINSISFSQIIQNVVNLNNLNDINMKDKSKNTKIITKSKSNSKDITKNIDSLVENDVKLEPKNEQSLNQTTSQTTNQTQYYSLIYKNEKIQSLDSNQKQFIEKLFLVLQKYPNKHLALLSYVNGNKEDEENIRIAKLRNKFIIDYMTKNGISENRISKKGVSGLIVKDNVKLFKNSNITEIIITEKFNFKK